MDYIWNLTLFRHGDGVCLRVNRQNLELNLIQTVGMSLLEDAWSTYGSKPYSSRGLNFLEDS